MFDSVLGRGQGVTTRFGAGASISVVLHFALIAWALHWSGRASPPGTLEAEVKFFASRPTPQPPPAPPRAAPEPPGLEKRVERRAVKRPEVFAQPKEVTAERPPPAEPEPEAAHEPQGQSEGEGVGTPGGRLGGTVGGKIGGQLDGQPGSGDGQRGLTEVLRFGEGMTRPAYPRSFRIDYTREALEARVEGTTIVECVITAEGEATGCKIIKPLPHMEKRVLETLQSWRFTPATFQGKPVSIRYTMTFTFRLR